MGRLGGGVVVAIALVLCSVGFVSEAQTLSNCQTEILQLAPCLTFVTGAASTPESSCCTAVKDVEAAEPVCLCELIGYGGNDSALLPAYNVTLAKMLPGLCDVQADPSQCPALINGTSSAPSSSPSGGPTTSSNPGGSTSGPSSGGPSSSHASSRIPGTVFTFWQLAAATAGPSLSLLLFVHEIGR